MSRQTPLTDSKGVRVLQLLKQGLDAATIAERLGISPKNVRATAKAARDRLAKQMEEES